MQNGENCEFLPLSLPRSLGILVYVGLNRKGFLTPHPRVLAGKRRKQWGNRTHSQHVTIYRDLAAVGNDFPYSKYLPTYNQEAAQLSSTAHTAKKEYGHIHQKPRNTLPSNLLILLLETYPKRMILDIKNAKYSLGDCKKQTNKHINKTLSHLGKTLLND